MRVEITPSLACGTLQVPPSKSVSHRALIAAALGEGTLVKNAGESADIEATLDCLAALGARAEKRGKDIFIGGLWPQKEENITVNARESGSTLRFLIPLALAGGRKVSFKGQGRLLERPLSEYQALCKERGFLFEKQNDGLSVCGKLKAGEYRIDGSRSSQFISGMLFVLPLLDGDSTLIVEGKSESISYINLTLQTLAQFGISVTQKENTYFIQGNQRYRAAEIIVEGDWSNAAFPDALGHLGGNVTLTGLNDSSAQGDKIYKEYFKKLGTNEPMDLSDCPDLAPILFALSAVYGGEFVGCKRLRLKESDRIFAMQTELQKCGIVLTATEDRVSISPDGLKVPDEVIDGHNDHRIVMAMTVLLTRLGGTIKGAEAVAKSYPNFFDDIRALGLEIKEC